MKGSLRVLGNRLLILKDRPDSMVGGIHVPDSAMTMKQKIPTGTVIAVGDGKKLKNGERAPIPVQIGAKVLVERWEGSFVRIEDEEYCIVDMSHVVGILDE